MKVYPSSLSGFVRPPSSKSVTHRSLILAACGEIDSVVKNRLISEDTDATKKALERLNTKFNEKQDHFRTIITENSISKDLSDDIEINCFNSGTTLRLLSGLCGLFPRKTTLYGDRSLNSRPMNDLSIALTQLGVKSITTDGTPPIMIQGPPSKNKNKVEVPGNISSQYISSLLIHGALRDSTELEIKVIPPVVSQPYIDLTVEMLKKLKIDIEYIDNTYYVTGVDQFEKFEYLVPMDYSSAAFYIAAGAIGNNRIVIEGIDNNLPQADSKIMQLVKEMGAKINIDRNVRNARIIVEGSELEGIDVNLQDAPDLFPIVCVLGLMANGETKISGAQHLAFKESNRIEAMVSIIKEMGGDITPLNDGAIIRKSTLKGGILNPVDDHRIVMATSIAATQCDKISVINNSHAVNVSYPTFFNDLNHLQ